MSPAVELRAAARTLRATAKEATAGRWSVDHEFPDIVISTEATWKGRPTIVASDLEGGDPAWIALASPGLAEPLAALLEGLADDMDGVYAVEGPASGAVHPVTPLGLGAPNRVWTAALAAARVVNGTEEDQ